MADYNSRNDRPRRDGGSNRPHRGGGNGERRSGGDRDRSNERDRGYVDRKTGERKFSDRDDNRGGYGRSRDGDDRRGYGRREANGDRNDRGFRSDRRNDDRREDRNERGERRFERREDRNDNRRSDDRRDGRREDMRREDRRDDRRSDDRRDNRRDDNRGDRRSNGDRSRGDRSHAQRAGAGRNEDGFRAGPQRSGFREERIAKRMNEPDIPADTDARDLDPSVLQDLKSLAKDNADTVAKHMIMAATLMNDDPQLALRHARAAKDRAGRVSVVRETAGIAAYHAGEWKEALAELRAARRMSGGPGMIAVMADCERALGRPEKALELARTEDLSGIDPDTASELAIVLAGARRDLGQPEAALIELQKEKLDPKRTGLTAARLFYVYADTLLEVGRTDDARKWFEAADKADDDGFLDSKERLRELG